METSNLLQILSSKSPISPKLRLKANLQPATTSAKYRLRVGSSRRRCFVLCSTDASNETPRPSQAAVTPAETVEIRFKRGSKRRMRERGEEEGQQTMKASNATPKKWEEMNLSEKVIDVYMGEKGMLFWLNKFAYASIFIVIGGWILFRFVGPALNLYQLDAPPLPPSSMFKS